MTVLNKTEVMVSIIPEKFFLLIVICLIIAFICAIMAFTSVGCPDFCTIAAVIFFIACITTFFIGTIFEKPSGRYRYECLIDDTVPFVEVVENYDVVSQRGELWILEDRDEISVD